jgi:hypothetical protein
MMTSKVGRLGAVQAGLIKIVGHGEASRAAKVGSACHSLLSSSEKAFEGQVIVSVLLATNF